MNGILAMTLLAAIEPSDLRLELIAQKSRLLLGEPTKVVLGWTALHSIEVVEGRETLLLDEGGGYRPYLEAVFSEKTTVRAAETLVPGATKRTSYEVGVEESDGATRPSVRFAFPTPGIYRIKVQYEAVSSNEVVIEVRPPSGAERDLFLSELISHAELLTVWITLRDTASATFERLAAQYPNSVYWARPHLLMTPIVFGEAIRRDLARGVRPAEGEARGVYDAASSRDLTGTAFADSHALLLAQMTEELLGPEPAIASYNAVLQTYPNTPAADFAGAWLADRESPLPTDERVLFLHGVGSIANPTTLILDEATPTGSTAKYRDSPSLNFSGGNPWKEVGSWTNSSVGVTGSLSTAGDLRLWLGLKNSDDQGTQFDVKAEIARNEALIGSGITPCVTGVTRNASLAKETIVPITVPTPVPLTSNEAISLRILTRIGTNTDGSKCSGPGGSHNNAVGLRVYFDATDRAARFSVTFQPTR